MSSDAIRVAVLGGGPAGLALADRLASRPGFRVTVFERGADVGGNAGSFDLAGMRVDYGSHRLHPACPREILEDIRRMLGSDLLRRPRHGRIRLRGRWVRFPLKPFDLLANLPPDFVLGFASDLLRRPRRRREESFASVLEAGLGRTICRDFYFPYARKIWGLDPEELDAEQARRRVSAGSKAKLLGKLVAALPGFGKPDSGIFYYPRGGFGQISEAFRDSAECRGAEVRTEVEVIRVEPRAGRGIRLGMRTREGEEHLEADMVLSSIPVTALARGLRPGPPAPVREALGRMTYQGMVLVYLVLPVSRFTEFDAHYFPGSEVAFSRISEPANYGLNGPGAATVICVEFPCAVGDAVWSQTDGELVARAVAGLRSCDLRVPEISSSEVRRLSAAYPIYRQGYREAWERVDAWVAEHESIVSFGRQGLFVHDNTHHTIAMAYALADSIQADGTLDAAHWDEALASFESFVVED